MIKAIIFDYDGVIVDSFPTVHKVYQIMCEKLGKKCPKTLPEFKEMYGKTSRVFMQRAGFTAEEMQKADAIYLEEVKKKETPFFPAIKEVIQQLSEKYLLFVLSSCPQEDLDLKLNRKGLAHFFVEVIGSTKLGPMKKVPALIELFERHHFKSDEVIMIGDRINDYEDAMGAGIKHIILVEYGWGYNKDEIPKHTQKVKVEKPEDLLTVIASIL